MADSKQDVVCGFDGNPDLFGLGVRVGIYIQMISFVLAGVFLPRESAYLQGSAFVFLLAIFIALIRETVAKTLHATEVALVAWLIIYQVIGVSSTLTKHLTVSSAVRMVLAFFIFPPFVGYMVWYWYVGIDTLPEGACGEYGFFWTKVNVRGWYRTLNKVIWTMAIAIVSIWGIIGGLLLLIAAVMGVVSIRRRIRERSSRAEEDVRARIQTPGKAPARASATAHLEKQDTWSSELRTKHPGLHKTLKCIGALFLAGLSLTITVTPMELLIKWNHVHGLDRLDSVGQLVPFILSAGQLVHVLYGIVTGAEEVKRGSILHEQGTSSALLEKLACADVNCE
ncbi:hypothetical protein GE09DRAFT_128712 [Coniochaeta sp. 2T2.1]|nr:hypothetical protein GE09DRAFT_128712 [Coniochaeta sp. 2T2.1]